MRYFSLYLALLLTVGLSAPILAEPRLVEDLHQGPGSNVVNISLDETAAVGGVLYFRANEPAHGWELWRTDGTAAGTRRATDVCPGPCASTSVDRMVPFHGQIYFQGGDGVSGAELWRSDGVPGSERRVRDLCPGSCDSYPDLFEEVHGALLFIAANGSEAQLWRTDGTRPGTTLLKAAYSINHLVKVRDRVLFVVSDVSTAELWSSDGTPGGTVRLDVPFGVGASLFSGPLPEGDFGWFWTTDALWRTDGTAAGTVRLKSNLDLLGTPQAFPFSYTTWNGQLFVFLAPGIVVRSDGTPDGTFALPQRLPDFKHPVTLPAGLVFSDGELFEPESLWRSRGTPETTEKFFQLPDGGEVVAMVAIGDRAIFKVRLPGLIESEIWVTDGTAAGTRRLEGIQGGSGIVLASSGALAFFVVGDSYNEAALWRTDGTEAGTWPVLDLEDLPASSGPITQTAFDDRLVFSARTSPENAPLFSSDGTPGGTHLLSRNAEWAIGFTAVAGRLFFGVDFDFGLWTTNGTPGGTKRVAGGVDLTQSPVAYRGQLLFGGTDSSDVELWKSDGRTASLVKNIDPFLMEATVHHDCIPEPSLPGPGLVVGDRLLFAANDGRNGRELWTTDGTEAGTRLLRDINPKRSPNGFFPCDDRRDTGLPSDPEELVPVRRGALFTADDGKAGRELWWTDGTLEGTHRVVDLRRGARGSMPHDLVPFRGKAYFIASDDGAGEKLWRTDGTAQGTVLVDDLKVGGTPSWARELTASRGRLFLAVYNELTGAELWTSRGDAGSTRLVVDLRPGAPGSYPQALTDVGGVLVFAADDGATGLEPWRSDGTAAGTVRLGDVNPGPDASSPGPFTRAGDDVFTGAYDAVHGRELYAIPLQEVLEP